MAALYVKCTNAKGSQKRCDKGVTRKDSRIEADMEPKFWICEQNIVEGYVLSVE